MSNPNNSCSFIGRLYRTPELKKTNSGRSVTNFSLIVDRNRPDGNGEWAVDRIDCVAWAGRAEGICSNWKQGDLVAVTGELQVRLYKNKEGVTVAAAEIVVDGRRKLATASKNAVSSPADYAEPPASTDEDFTELDDPGELPL